MFWISCVSVYEYVSNVSSRFLKRPPEVRVALADREVLRVRFWYGRWKTQFDVWFFVLAVNEKVLRFCLHIVSQTFMEEFPPAAKD